MARRPAPALPRRHHRRRQGRHRRLRRRRRVDGAQQRRRAFADPQFVLADFGFEQGWRVDKHPRFLADITGDGKADIVGFGDAGVWTALSNGDGTFQAAQFVLAELRLRARAGGSTSTRASWPTSPATARPTSSASATTACGRRSATATAPSRRRSSCRQTSASSRDWRVDKHPRFLADITGDGKADIVGFGDAGVWTALSNGDGTFQAAQFVQAELRLRRRAGGWTSTRASWPTSPATARPTSSASATPACGRRSATATASFQAAQFVLGRLRLRSRRLAGREAPALPGRHHRRRQGRHRRLRRRRRVRGAEQRRRVVRLHTAGRPRGLRLRPGLARGEPHAASWPT